MQPKSLADKLFKNEHNEVSLSKVGIICAGLGAALLANPLPPEVVFMPVAKLLASLGGICTALGLLSKKGRK